MTNASKPAGVTDADLAALLARREIRDQLSRYCRALDRMDKPLAYAVWHEDGTASYLGMYEGTGRGFVDWVWKQHEPMQCHSHQITNVLAQVEGDAARSEAYVTVVLWLAPDAEGARMEIVVRGRYLDRWSRRDGRWAIDHRVHVVDTHTQRRLAPGEHGPSQSARDASDPSFALFDGG